MENLDKLLIVASQTSLTTLNDLVPFIDGEIPLWHFSDNYTWIISKAIW
jgi:hypothetical protein